MSEPDKKPNRFAWQTALGVWLLLISVGCFVGTQWIPGLRPLVLASAPIALDRTGSAQVSYQADVTAPVSVILSLPLDKTEQTKKLLGLDTKKKETEDIPSPDVVTVTCDPAGAYSASPEKAFEAADARHVALGSIRADALRRYTVTATVVKPFPAAQKSDPHIEVHRSIAGWGRAFPKMLGMGVLGVVLGMAGVMMTVWGGLLQHKARTGQSAL